jgi:5-methylthioadenosine/S-adenosylhomocysteine deaminase
MPTTLTGKVVSLDAPPLDDGAVHIDDEGVIAAVGPASKPPPEGFEDAARVETGGVIYPGLIDLHNHVAYNTLPLWRPPGRAEPYTRRDQWPRDPSYKPQIRDPVDILGRAAGKALLKYVEVKALVGGVTAIQGSAKTATPYEGWLVRNVEYETFGTKRKTVYQSVRTLSDDADFEAARKHMKDGASFIYHLAEGTADSLVDEYTDLRDHRCLSPHLLGIHSTALHPEQFEEWGRKGGSIVWSPFSNLWLYHGTTDVPAAAEAGIRVCLGTDWSPSGSKSLLHELKVADLYNREHLDGAFSDEALCRMVTSNPADALDWEKLVGRLKPGRRGDVLVTAGRNDDPYRNLIEATHEDVELVLINGRAAYGSSALMKAAGVGDQEAIRVGTARRRIKMTDPDVPEADMTWEEVVDALEAVRDDPVQAIKDAGKRGPALQVIPDMPWDDPALFRAPADPATTTIPPLDPLAPDDAYFDAIESAPILDGMLDGLRRYYD